MEKKEKNKINRCPNCNSKLNIIEEGHSVLIQCTNCDYSVVGDVPYEWEEDETTYSIYFIKNNNPLFDTMKFISKKLQIGIVKTKEIISKDDAFYIKGQAWQLKDIIKELNDNNIDYKITPKFKYKF